MNNMSKMTDEERREKALLLDHDLDAFIEEEIARSRERREKNSQPERTVGEILEEMSTHPAFLKEIDYTKPLHPATEALIALEYDTDDAQDRAEKYKADGNDNFKRGRYKWAIDNYNEAIKANCSDRLTNAILYSNRAAANYYIGNFRSALNDVIVARKFIPTHLKAIIRGAQCCYKLNKLEDCQTWCNSGLLIENDNKSLCELKDLCKKEKKIQDRNRRQEAQADRKRLQASRKILDAISSRGIQLKEPVDGNCDECDDLSNAVLTCHHPQGQAVHLADDGTLVWPVLFLYPEYSESDFIQAMNETDTFLQHLRVMFDSPPHWDTAGCYTLQDMRVFFKDKHGKLERVDGSNTLLQALQHDRYELHGGTPTFFILSMSFTFYETYLDGYSL